MPQARRRGAPSTRRDRCALTTTEAGRLLGVTATRVRQFIAAGRIRADRIGRDYVLTKGDVRRFAKTPRLRRGPPVSLRSRKETR